MPKIVSFSDAHLVGALALSQGAGWEHRLADWQLILSVSQGVAAIQDGAVVGTACCSVFGDQARLNMVIVDPAHRGRGLGMILMQAVMQIAGARSMTLVATTQGVPLYRKLGFAPGDEVVQHKGAVQQTPPPRQSVSISAKADLNAIASMDRSASGMERTDLLRRIAGQGTVFVASRGYAVLRDFGSGQVLGPVVAADTSTAHDLVRAAAQGRQGQPLRIDTTPRHDLRSVCAQIGLTEAGGGLTMHRGPAPILSNKFATYALASQALG